MTLRRTIHRREARKRAKLRLSYGPPLPFIVTDWIAKEQLAILKHSISLVKHLNRSYGA